MRPVRPRGPGVPPEVVPEPAQGGHQPVHPLGRPGQAAVVGGRLRGDPAHEVIRLGEPSFVEVGLGAADLLRQRGGLLLDRAVEADRTNRDAPDQDAPHLPPGGQLAIKRGQAAIRLGRRLHRQGHPVAKPHHRGRRASPRRERPVRHIRQAVPIASPPCIWISHAAISGC